MSKKKVAIIAAAAVIVVAVCCLYHFRYYFTGPGNRPVDALENVDFGIGDIRSSVDMDNDGIDDQTDILQGARDYIAARPRYKSKYYHTGYSDDKYGVCTDVVANAMRSAGYDLMQLVHEDILENPGDYDIEEADINIDFRRVQNLKVYFAHTAIPVTLDVHDIAQWQGGDIVIFEKHIGIVSDKRNENGVSYIIHHNSPMQAFYEEDILEKRDDLVAHYRVSE